MDAVKEHRITALSVLAGVVERELERELRLN